jgi:hypothetical protein
MPHVIVHPLLKLKQKNHTEPKMLVLKASSDGKSSIIASKANKIGVPDAKKPIIVLCAGCFL